MKNHKKHKKIKMNPTSFKVTKRISLPVNQETIKNPEFIPKKVQFEDNHKVLESVAIVTARSMPCLLVGETGTGKTSLVRHLASNTNNAFVRVNHNGGTSIEDILGRYIINTKGETEWVDGVLIEAMKKGYWYLADEINAASPEVNFVYHALLDDDARVVLVEKGHEVVTPHPNFRFFGAMNPPQDYAGTKELNKALLSRFAVVQIDFAPPKTEQKILVSRTGVDPEVAEKMVKFAAEIRVNHSKEEMRFVLSTRDLLMWATLFQVYGLFQVSAEMSVLNKVSPDDSDTVKDLMGLHFKTLDENIIQGSKGTVKSQPEEADPDYELIHGNPTSALKQKMNSGAMYFKP